MNFLLFVNKIIIKSLFFAGINAYILLFHATPTHTTTKKKVHTSVI